MRRRPILIAILALAAVVPSSAEAFDTQPHADITHDAFTAEGASPGSADIGVVTNWFVDYYTNPDKNPYSGHGHALLALARLIPSLSEDWPDAWVRGAQRLQSALTRLRSMPR